MLFTISSAMTSTTSHCKPVAEQSKHDVTQESGIPCSSKGQGDQIDAITVSQSPTLFQTVTGSDAQNDPKELIRICAEAEKEALLFKDNLTHKIGETMTRFYMDIHPKGFTVSSGSHVLTETQTKTRYETDIYHIRVALIYMDQIKLDDNQKANNEFQDNILNLQQKLKNLFCHLRQLVDMDPDVTDDVMPQEERQIVSIAQRLKRDFIFVRDMHTLLGNLKTSYIALQSSSEVCKCL